MCNKTWWIDWKINKKVLVMRESDIVDVGYISYDLQSNFS